MFIARCLCPKGILGLGGKASKNKLKDTSFIFPTTKVTLLGVFRTHAQKEYGKVWKMMSIPILNILTLLLLKNKQCFYSKSCLNDTQYKDVKWGVGVESARFHGIVNGESLWNVFCCLLWIFYYWTAPILKTLGKFENLMFLIMSTRGNIRLIARNSLRFFLTLEASN